MTSRHLLLLMLATLLSGCGGRDDDGPVVASVIGEAPALADPSQKPLDPSSAVLLGATAQGLVRFDATGQIEPGLAIRWDVSDDGLYYTFRLATGLGLDAEDAARRLRAVIGPTSRNPLKPLFGGIEEIVAVTPEVIEIRLVAPQPDLLDLLAQPELALLGEDGGTGPFAIAIRQHRTLVLEPVADPDADPPSEDDARRRRVTLRGERAALAVARFQEGESDFVTGGTFANLAIARRARLPARTLRFDPAPGLFGLAVVEPEGFLVNADNRRALAMAIDRDRIATSFAVPGWRAMTSLVPPGAGYLAQPATPDWIDTSPPLRRLIAARIVESWRARTPGAHRPKLRVAMPRGPGARLLFTLIAIDWAAIGIDAEQVPIDADADLRLIDAVAPTAMARWYLSRFGCKFSRLCSEQADIALAASDRAQTAAERTAMIVEADQRLNDIVAFLPIAQPVRWSLAAPRLAMFQENPRAIHPLQHLLAEPR